MIEHSFVKRIVGLITGQKAIEVMTLHWIWQAISAGASLFGGYKAGQAAREGGEAAREASYLNAADLRDLAEFNSAGYREAGAVNAGAIRTVGAANELAVKNATARNTMMYGMQAEEDRRRHMLQERTTAGTIRAMVGASGVQTNTGSPLHYLNHQVDLGIQERRFGDIKAYWTLRNMYEEGTEKAAVIRLTAEQQAMVTEYNANLQAEMSYAEAMRQATSMERSGDVSAATGAAQGSAAMWGGIAGAASALGGINFGGLFGGLSGGVGGGTSTGAYAFTGGAFKQSNSWGTFAPTSSWGAFSNTGFTTTGAYG
jgi:hypothetical protein